MEAFVGVIIGGLISVATTLTVDAVRNRRELRHRWDDDGLEAIEHFIDAANLTIGALYDEGRRRFVDEADSPELMALDRTARTHMDSLRVAHARARLILRPLEGELADYRTALDDLRRLADTGFAVDDLRWKEAQSQLYRQLDIIIEGAGQVLGLREV